MTPVTTPERHRQVQAVFADAAERPAAERGTFLDAACAGDAVLRAEVESLLGAEADVPDLLGATLSELAAVLADGGTEPALHGSPAHEGQTLGPYRLLRELGRGGMGTVYLAERADVARRVALKLVRDPLAAPEHVDRFLLERRVLARLDHPHIARLLDAGVTPEGTPWFAMEFVEGEPIDRACDRQRLGITERLALFEQACEAVQYAHEHLVVHRDLKPSNILVGASGGVKLLDFGIAKLLGEAGDGGTTGGLTGTGVRLLTPDYAAPEQLRGEPVTTAADVYALGVVLYGLLTGQHPHARRRGTNGDVRYEPSPEPARPSSVVAGAEPAVCASVSAARATNPERLARQLRGDLDTVVLKALAAEPARRYPSAQQFLDDVRRYRAGRPVAARPDTWRYRARKFVARNRAGVGALAATFLMLAGVAAVTTYQRAEVVRERDRARHEAVKARQVTQFVTSLFQAADPYRTGSRPTSSIADGGGSGVLLGLGADRLERELAGQPAVQVELLRTLGVVARNLGRYDDADSLLRRGLATRRQLLGTHPGPDADLAGLLHELGVVRRAKSDFPGADTLLTQALAARAALPGDAGADLTATRLELGALRRLQGRYGEAERLLGLALAAERGAPGPAAADALEELAEVRLMEHDADSAAALQRQVVALRERGQGREHPAVARAYFRLSIMLRNARRTGEAERAVRRALELQRGRLPADHPEVLAAESELSWDLLERGAYAEAERVQRRVLRGRERLYGAVHRDVAGSAFTLGAILYRRGQLAAAAGLLRRAVDTYARVEDPDHPEVNDAREWLAVAEAARGHEAEALAVTARLLRARHVAMWDATAQPLDALAALLRTDGNCRRAAPLARRALAAYTARHAGAPPGDTLLVRLRAGAAACARGRDAAGG